MGARGSSTNITIRAIPYRYDPYIPLTTDSWQYKEGAPPPINSPIVKYRAHPWYNFRKYTEPINTPKFYNNTEYAYQPDGAYDYAYRKDYSRLLCYNKPSFITDHHIIALRRQIENIWSPKFYGHIHLGVSGQLRVEALKKVHHHMFSRAMAIGWDSFGIDTNSAMFSFGEGGISTGHVHYWGADAGGSQVWTASLQTDHGGGITPKLGNYTVLDISYRVNITHYKRIVYSQDSMRHYTQDYDAMTEDFHQPVPSNFFWEEVMLYCMDAGALIFTYDNTWAPPGAAGPHPENRRPFMSRDRTFEWSSCTLPYTENQLDKWFSGGRSHTVEYPALGGNGSILDETSICSGKLWMERPHLGRDITQAIYYPHESFIEEGKGTTWSKTIQGYCNEVDPPENQPAAPTGSGDRWMEMLIGTKVVPTWFVTTKDLLGRTQTHTITDTEYSGTL